MSSNLPPGVTVGMLPGNTPEDAAEEALYDSIYEVLGYDADITLEQEAIAGKVANLINKAYGDGYAQGASDERMAEENQEPPL